MLCKSETCTCSLLLYCVARARFDIDPRVRVRAATMSSASFPRFVFKVVLLDSQIKRNDPENEKHTRMYLKCCRPLAFLPLDLLLSLRMLGYNVSSVEWGLPECNRLQIVNSKFIELEVTRDPGSWGLGAPSRPARRLLHGAHWSTVTEIGISLLAPCI